MKLLWGDKDGGPESKSWVWGVEIKWLFSILLLKFAYGSREAYHSHAFNAISWLFKGRLLEHVIDRYYPSLDHYNSYVPSWRPIITRRTTMHMVSGIEKSNWAITFRGPWHHTWEEWLPKLKRHIFLTHGRREC